MKAERAFRVKGDMTRPSSPAYGWVIVAQIARVRARVEVDR